MTSSKIAVWIMTPKVYHQTFDDRGIQSQMIIVASFIERFTGMWRQYTFHPTHDDDDDDGSHLGCAQRLDSHVHRTR
jgi:hypothetical protein